MGDIEFIKSDCNKSTKKRYKKTQVPILYINKGHRVVLTAVTQDLVKGFYKGKI